jgi:hypothetical protein
MSREVISLNQFFEVVWQTNQVKLNRISIEALDTTWMDISMNEIHLM